MKSGGVAFGLRPGTRGRQISRVGVSPGRIAIVGSGAIGLFYGAKLAVSGADVHFLMRSDLPAVRERGILIRSEDGETRLPKAQAAGAAEEIGPCDTVIIALKATANAALENLIPPLLKDGTALLTLQNGLGNEEFLAERFGLERVMGGLCFVCLNRVDHGVVEHYGHGRVSIGEFVGPPQERTHAIANAFRTAGIDTEVVGRLMNERWRKLVWNVPFNGLAIAAGGATVEDLLGDSGMDDLVRDLMGEVITAAAAVGESIPEAYADYQVERSRSMGAYKASSLIDWMAGRPVEVEAIWGEPLRRAKNVGCDLPRLDMLYQLLRNLTVSQE